MRAAIYGILILAGSAGCHEQPHFRCTDTAACNLGGGGTCSPSPTNDGMWCSYPDPSCPSGLRYSDQQIGDGDCVPEGDDPDAGIDAPVSPPPDSVGGITAGMITIPAGSFWRGCNPSNPNPYPCNSGQLERETPYRELTLSQFWIDKVEVDQEHYAACVAANGCTAPAPVDPSVAADAGYDPANKPDHPVSNVTWAQARAYCMWLGKRLPTEAEWEKAARGDDGRMYPWGDMDPDIACTYANVGVCTGSGTHAVGSHPAGDSPYGVSDMAGNVAEFTNDLYSATYYADAPATDPVGPLSGNERVVRGAGYPHSNTGARTAWRATSGANAPADYATGFRCAYTEP